MIQQRTVPGVYINEQNAFPNSVVEVATALPVFIGYTQTASFQGQSLANELVEITSFADYLAFFENGPTQGPQIQYALNPSAATDNPAFQIPINGKQYTIAPVAGTLFYLYNALQLFFQNGGGNCYVISVGNYTAGTPKLTDFVPTSTTVPSVFDILSASQDPTLICIPDALLMNSADYYTLMGEALIHCSKVKNRMVLMDAWGGNTVTNQLTFLAEQASNADPISTFRQGIGINNLNYGACYYPWLNTNIVSSNNITYNNLQGGLATFSSTFAETANASNAAQVKAITAIVASATATPPVPATAVHNALMSASPNYKNIMNLISTQINCLPAVPAVLGAIAAVDGSQGVWKAPANVSLVSVQSPVFQIDDNLQSNMNVDAITGKSVNAIRAFTGQGVLIWGARTLDGNSQDWRYLSVRRTLIMLEQSIKLACQTYVFANNDANTWQNVKSMIENFLTGIWKQGGLAGGKPAEAFSVSVGLGSTMTAQDILDGYMEVTVLVAVTHPAEFIEITFQQQLQQS